MDITAVIPTCDRPRSLVALLRSLQASRYPLAEVIIVDGGGGSLAPPDYQEFSRLDIRHVMCAPSVTRQRNLGIRHAQTEWIFLCDDDMLVPPDYLGILSDYQETHPAAGALSGRVFQQQDGDWQASYPVVSRKDLLWRFIFGLGIWGEIRCGCDGYLSRALIRHFARAGNHLSPAGWPVITDFSGACFTTPVYGLGASVIRRRWLTLSPYDEQLDRHGLGDHYGVIAGFPVPEVHVVNEAHVYHFQAKEHRLSHPDSYYNRVMALDYFRRRHQRLTGIRKGWLLWSLVGNLLAFLFSGKWLLAGASFRALWGVLSGQNPCLVRSAARQPPDALPGGKPAAFSGYGKIHED